MRRELLDVRAQRPAGAARDRAHAREVLVPEGDGLDEDVERVDVALARERLRLVHPRVGGEARRHGVGEQAGDRHRLHDARGELAPEPRGARLALAREPVARLALEHGRAVLRASRARAPRPARAPPRRTRRRASAPTTAMPPPARAISSYGTPVTLRSYSSARQPANGRCVWQSTKPGSTAQPLASIAASAGRVDARSVAGAAPGRASARPRGRGAGTARRGGAAPGPRRAARSSPLVPPSRIGIRTPSRSAASIASG